LSNGIAAKVELIEKLEHSQKKYDVSIQSLVKQWFLYLDSPNRKSLLHRK
jgi:hypothetical protein